MSSINVLSKHIDLHRLVSEERVLEFSMSTVLVLNVRLNVHADV